MYIAKPHLCSKLEVWEPRYYDKMCLIKKRKVDFGSPILIITFPKSNAYKDGRYAITKAKAQTYPTQPHGTTAVYLVPVHDLEPYETPQDIVNTANMLWP